MQFINREQEKKDLIAHLETEPNAILFLYGPKSCGKTSLIEKTINDLDQKKYAINYLNLRRIIINDFKSFFDVFFQKSVSKKAKEIISNITFNVGFFKVGIEDEEMMKKNAFKVMDSQLRDINKKGIKPVIIIDEIQNLKSIYMNGERRLLDELFNFFIALTKETHLAHIVLATSDSYFIEEIHNNAKLSKTCIFRHIDHLEKKDVEKWLSQEEYKLNKKDIKYIWDNLGGSPWEIWQVIVDIQKGDDIQTSVQRRIDSLKSQVVSFYNDFLNEKEAKQFRVISRKIAKNKKYIRKKREVNKDLIKKVVDKDIWFYNVFGSEITANSRSLEIVFKEF